MKVLKSGVEMTPEEMRKSHGGMCACGCAPSRDADSSWTWSESGTNCHCFCEPEDWESQDGMGQSAYKYIWDY